jgi:hypothetical protein
MDWFDQIILLKNLWKSLVFNFPKVSINLYYGRTNFENKLYSTLRTNFTNDNKLLELEHMEFNIKCIVFQSINDNGYSFFILKGFVLNEDKVHTICGEIKESTLKAGDNVVLRDAKLEYNTKYSTYEYKSKYLMELVYPIDKKHALARMKTMKIKPGHANIIYNEYPDDPWKCINEKIQPSGISIEHWQTILDNIDLFKGKPGGKSECEIQKWLESYGLKWGSKISTSIAQHFFKKLNPLTEVSYTSETIIATILNDLLVLREVSGIGIEKLKQLVSVLNMSEDKKKEFNAVLNIYDKQQTSGHLYFKVGEIPNIENPADFPSRIYVNPQTKMFCLIQQMEEEKNIADELDKLNDYPINVTTVDVEPLSHLTDEQNQAYRNAMVYTLSIIAGVPGGGKTYTVCNIISEWLSMFQNVTVLLLAPTGKAVYRLKEMCSLFEDNKQIHCMTIHKLIYTYRNLGIPLQDICMVIDESSMVDTHTCNLLIEFVKQHKIKRMVFVGDHNQLPPVGYGDVFRNILESERFKTTTLNTIFRQVGGETALKKAIQSVKNRKVPEIISDDLTYERICIQMNIEHVFMNVVKRYSHEEYERQEVLIITSTNKSVQEYQLKLANAINPNRKCVSNHNQKLVAGDVVRHCGNVYSKDLVLLNGTPGLLTFINKQDSQVNFNDGQIVTYDGKNDIDKNVELGYIGTVHKSQGSESRVVIILLETYTSLVHNWCLLYTAITRAKEKCIVIGPDRVYTHMVSTKALKRRTTLRGHFDNII